MLQTELVVGALSCGTTPHYNAFVMAYRPDLMNAQKTLMRFFAHESKLEDYKSKTANEVSQRSLTNSREFCSSTGALYDKLLGPEKPMLAIFAAAEPAASRHGYEICGTTSSEATRPMSLGAGAQADPKAKTVPYPRAKPEAVVVSAPSAGDAAAPAPVPAAKR